MSARPASYLAALALTTTFAVLSVGTVNVLADPYRIFGTTVFTGINVVKPRAQQRRVESKWSQIERIHPRTVILGNSRAEVGFDPESHAWPAGARPVYNFAIPGSGLSDARDQFHQVLKTQKPGRILIGVDFLDFLTTPDASVALPSEKKFEGWSRVRTKIGALLSLDAFVDSLRTLAAQHDAYAADLSPLGFNPMRDYVRITRSEGYYGLFRQRYLESRQAFARAPKAIRNAAGIATEFALLEEILDEAVRAGMNVDLVTYPYHGVQLLLFEESGLWPAFESWKRELARVLERYPGVATWEFAVFDDFTRQPIPGPSERPGTSPWYWEPSHFKRELGDRILEIVLNCREMNGCGRRFPTEEGLLEAHLAEQRRLRDSYNEGVIPDSLFRAQGLARTERRP